MTVNKINSFRDLIAWQKSQELAVMVFKTFKNTNNNLRNQIERSSLSITSNIAEGFGRSSQKDKKHFYIMARGSAYEVQSQLYLALEIGDINKNEFNELLKLSETSTKIIHGLIGSIKL